MQPETSGTDYGVLFETARVGVFGMDLQTGKITYANASLLNLLGYSRTDLLGKTTAAIGLLENPSQRRDAIDALRTRGYYRREDLLARTKEGREIAIECLSITVGADMHAALCIVNEFKQVAQGEFGEGRETLQDKIQQQAGELRDAYRTLQSSVQQREWTEEQLRRVQKLEEIGNLSAGIAHDFNNILTAILGFGELTLGMVSDDTLRRYLGNILKAGARGQQLVKHILGFSRTAEQQAKPVKLATVVKENVEFLGASLPSTIDIKLNLSTEGTVIADPVQMQQIIMNLATNAAQAMQERGGVLTIQLEEVSFSSILDTPYASISPGRYVQLSVQDTGAGIPDSIVAKIFDPFFTTKAGGGTGLGLSVVSGIVESLGGTISVQSRLGKGSTFHVFLPTSVLADNAVEVGHLNALPHGHERILFVDDEPLLAEMGHDMLADLGCRVIAKSSSRQALALFSRDPYQFDLVIIDQTMPEMTGLELAGKMVSLRSDLSVIVCSGLSRAIDTELTKKSGIKAFIRKPFRKREIAVVVRKVLDGI